ncbi:trans-aconitate 2-methyltransferase [Mycobacterium sp. pV006]|uniref:trans-aconitate 2-methyltransferase n=1 Tax=Mycobacterium sp. pV006 TaxID=3238983 RepID=UPI00351BCE5B
MSPSTYESGEYLLKNPDWHEGDAPTKAAWILDILSRNALAPAHVVEVGAGSGEILAQLAAKLPDATFDGYDISPQAYQIASPKRTDRLTFHHEDFLAADTSGIDLLMAIDVFEHVEDYMAFLKALRPRAEFKLFHIPLDLSVQTVLRSKPILGAREQLGHLHYFSKDTALAVLGGCGYEVLDWNYTHGAEELPDRATRTRIVNLARRSLRALHEDLAVRLMGGSSIMVLTK